MGEREIKYFRRFLIFLFIIGTASIYCGFEKRKPNKGKNNFYIDQKQEIKQHDDSIKNVYQLKMEYSIDSIETDYLNRFKDLTVKNK